MEVNNIFSLLNKFSKKEDQITAGFGFLLKNDRKAFKKFLKMASIEIPNRVLKKIDIETQTTFDGGNSIIDLQISLYGEFIIILESKLYDSKSIVIQLEKYSKILKKLEGEYREVRLFFVGPNKMEKKLLKNISLKINKNDFILTTWEILLNKIFTRNNRLEKLFKENVGDFLFSTKVIANQKVKDLVEVLVAFTNNDYWKLAVKEKIGVQHNNAPDAKYFAFYRTHRDSKGRREKGKIQAITHIAEVIKTEKNIPIIKTHGKLPNLKKRAKEKGFIDSVHKVYYLKSLMPLARPLYFEKGKKSIGQRSFMTTMQELLRVKTVNELKSIKKLKQELEEN